MQSDREGYMELAMKLINIQKGGGDIKEYFRESQTKMPSDEYMGFLKSLYLATMALPGVPPWEKAGLCGIIVMFNK